MTADRRVEVPVEIQAGWGYQDKVHGGYLLATAVGAAMRGADRELHPYPLAASALYVANPVPGAATVAVRALRAGRTVATYAMRLEQDGRTCVEVLLTAGRLPGLDEGARWDAGTTPVPLLPPPEQCLCGEDHETWREPRPQERMTIRLEPATAPPPYGPGGVGDFRAWVRCAEPDPVLGALILADAPPPITFDLALRGWVPTLQLQVLLRRVPPAGWLVARQSGTLLAGGLLDEDCTLWDPGTGAVVAQARQLAAYRDP